MRLSNKMNDKERGIHIHILVFQGFQSRQSILKEINDVEQRSRTLHCNHYMRFTCCDQLPVQRSHWPENDIIVNWLR